MVAHEHMSRVEVVPLTHIKLASTTHAGAQPSPARVLPSSHTSLPKRRPSPHLGKQATPDPSYPLEQPHVKLPEVLVHWALMWQLSWSVLSVHSSTSRQNTPLPSVLRRHPALQEHPSRVALPNTWVVPELTGQSAHCVYHDPVFALYMSAAHKTQDPAVVVLPSGVGCDTVG